MSKRKVTIKSFPPKINICRLFFICRLLDSDLKVDENKSQFFQHIRNVFEDTGPLLEISVSQRVSNHGDMQEVGSWNMSAMFCCH